MKDPLLQYCLRLAYRGFSNGMGSIYSAAPFVQRGHGIGSFLIGLGKGLSLQEVL
jgi:hypothetical protein